MIVDCKYRFLYDICRMAGTDEQAGKDMAGEKGRRAFFAHLAQTSNAPLALDIVKAEGVICMDVPGNNTLTSSGVSVFAM